MLDILRNFVAETTTPEMLSALEKAHDTFDTFDIPDYEGDFEQLLMLHDEVDAGKTMSDIVDLTRSIQFRTLGFFSVRMDEDSTVSILDTVLRGIQLIPAYDNKELMAKTAKLDGDLVEVFCEILALVTHLSPEELLTHIEEVNQFTITRIIEMCTENDAELLSHDEAAAIKKDSDECMHRLRLFMTMLNTEKLMVVELLQNGCNTGYPFTTYADMVGGDFQGMLPQTAAVEMYAMALVSCDGSANPPMTIQANIERYVHDMDIVTKINLQAKDLQLAMER